MLKRRRAAATGEEPCGNASQHSVASRSSSCKKKSPSSKQSERRSKSSKSEKKRKKKDKKRKKHKKSKTRSKSGKSTISNKFDFLKQAQEDLQGFAPKDDASSQSLVADSSSGESPSETERDGRSDRPNTSHGNSASNSVESKAAVLPQSLPQTDGADQTNEGLPHTSLEGEGPNTGAGGIDLREKIKQLGGGASSFPKVQGNTPLQIEIPKRQADPPKEESLCVFDFDLNPDRSPSQPNSSQEPEAVEAT